MPDRAWKQAERRAGRIIGGRRYPANLGAAVDCESDSYVAQVKHVRTCSLAQLEALALEAARQGGQRRAPKLGLVLVKRRAGRGAPTPFLVVMTEATFRDMNGARAWDTLMP